MSGEPAKLLAANATSANDQLPPKRWRWNRWRYVLVLSLLGFVPYPTQVFPEIRVDVSSSQSIREQLTSVPVWWAGITNAGTVEGHDHFDRHGYVSLPAKRLWASAYSRWLGEAGFWGKLQMPRGQLWFDLPSGCTIDAEAMGLTRLQNAEATWLLPGEGDELSEADETTGGHVWIVMRDPTWNRSLGYMLMLRDAPPRTTTQPVR